MKCQKIVWGLFIAMWCTGGHISGQADSPRDAALVPMNFSKCWLANHECRIVLRDRRQDKDLPVHWTLLKDQRIVARGMARPGNRIQGDLVVQFVTPKIRDHSVLELALKVSWEGDRLQLPVFVFDENPFLMRKQFLAMQNVHLFDPIGKTQRQFKEMEIPHQTLKHVDRFSAVTGGLIVIGEGLCLSEQDQLSQAITQVALRGVNVLVLAPQQGEVVLLAGENDLGPRSLQDVKLSHSAALTDLQRQFDTDFWSGSHVRKTKLVVGHSPSGFSVQVSNQEFGWPWMIMSFCQRKNDAAENQIVICGYKIIEQWDEGPVPRHALWQIINRFAVD